MADSTAARPPITSVQDVDLLLNHLDELYVQQAELDSKYALKAKILNEEAENEKGPILSEIVEYESEIRTFALRRRPSLLRRFGRTIKLVNGTLKFRIIPASLQTPKDTKALVNLLLSIPGGKRYLTATWSLNRKALTRASSDKLWRRLRALGAWVGKQEALYLETDHSPEGHRLHIRRYPNVQ